MRIIDVISDWRNVGYTLLSDTDMVLALGRRMEGMGMGRGLRRMSVSIRAQTSRAVVVASYPTPSPPPLLFFFLQRVREWEDGRSGLYVP